MQNASATKTDHDRDIGGPRSLTRVLGLLDTLSDTADGLSLAELSVILNSPKSSLLALLRPLVAEGYLIHEAGIYRLGSSIYRLAARMLANWDFPKLIRPYMVELAEFTGETVLLGVLNHEAETLTYVEMTEGPHPIRYHVPVGTTRTLYGTASGRLLLAFADKKWCDNYVSTVVFKTKTATPTTRTALKRELNLIRKEGVSTAIDLYVKGLTAIAAPVSNAAGQCIASLTLAGPTDRFKNELDSLQKIVKDIANKASGIL